MDDLITTTFFAIMAAAFIVGTVVGITGMGGGALMTPALIFLGVGDASTVVTADLTAAAVYKTGGAVVHGREGSPNFQLAKWLILGSVPMALLGPYLVAGGHRRTRRARHLLKMWIGFALLLAATTYALRLYIELRRGARWRAPSAERPDDPADPDHPRRRARRPAGRHHAVGSGSVIMIALLMLYPALSALKLVGTDLVQAVPLVMAAAISNIAINGLDWSILIPLLIGSVPGSILGSKIAPRVPQSFIRRGIVVVLTMSGLALLDKAGWAPLGSGEDETHPVFIGVVGIACWSGPDRLGAAAPQAGLPMCGAPTVAELEDPIVQGRERRMNRR